MHESAAYKPALEMKAAKKAGKTFDEYWQGQTLLTNKEEALWVWERIK
jgi:hypothetical protein